MFKNQKDWAISRQDLNRTMFSSVLIKGILNVFQINNGDNVERPY